MSCIYFKMSYLLLIMYLTVHNKIQFSVSKVCLAIHSLNLDLITMIKRLTRGVC